MTHCRLYLSILLLFMAPVLMHAKDFNLNRLQFYLGPEYYYAIRTKDGGAKQKGSIFGLRLGYDRLKRYGWYWGADALYSYGHLKGRSPNGNKLHSNLRDSSIEGRLGYTFQQKHGFQLAFTPYLGGGYFEEKNHFEHPTPLHVHFKSYYSYLAIGFLSWAHISERLEAGINFKVKIPYEPKCGTSHDPDHASTEQNIKEKPQYRIDLPVTYRLSCDGQLGVTLMPFFEIRQYGGCPNYPFDFETTKLHIWGLTLEYLYRL